jgi:hypothetical protein
MKARILGLAVALLFVGSVGFAANKTYTGEIMDSACAAAGSHAGMMKGNPNMTAKDCTNGCVAHGAKYVLYDADSKTVYQLDDQKKPVQFAGAKVTVTGTLDDATKTIHVARIKAS